MICCSQRYDFIEFTPHIFTLIRYSAWMNPFNGKKSFVSYLHTRFIVFWSKYPAPLLPFLTILKEKQINCYIQYTLNDYEKECLEKGVPSVEKRIDTFKRLVDELGFGHVVWRFDPLMLTDQVDIPSLMENFYRGTFERVYRKTSI